MENNTSFTSHKNSEASQQLGFLSQSDFHPKIAEKMQLSGESIQENLLDKESFNVEAVIVEKDLSRSIMEGFDGNQESKNLRKEIDSTEAEGKEEVFSLKEADSDSDSESFLEMKKKLLLEEFEAMLVPVDENPPCSGGMMLTDQHKDPKNMNVLEDEKENISEGIVDNCSGKMMLIDEEPKNMNVLEDEKENSSEGIVDDCGGKMMLIDEEPKNMNVLGGSLRNSLKIEVIDETALVEPAFVSKNEKGEEIGIFCPARSVQIKKNKRSRRRAREAKIPQIHSKFENVNERFKNAEGNKIMYLRKELEALRFVNVVEQRKLWKAIYKELMPSVAREYSSLTSSNHPKKTGISSDPAIIRKACSESLDGMIENIEADNEIKTLGSSDPSCNLTVLEEECSEYSDDDKYYRSIQRPAFSVEGEPNFDSGPPEDGMEYLRRVKWEASHIPNVAVAKVDRSKFKKEQSVYMPVIPVIAECPEHLLPSKQWEDAFLTDFSELRQALLCFEEQDCTADDSESIQSDVIFYEKFDSVIIPNRNDQSILPAEDIDLQPPQKLTAQTSVKDSCTDYPYLSSILKMDSVFRVSSLRKRISSVETQTSLSRIDCVWLFALSAAVDTPLDADTSAAFRSLLRKCASLRAEKAELDDEVIMLNILATISGRYFGQSEN